MIRDSVIDWQELSALYERADALGEAELAAWLAQLRSERHRLMPQLERMLEAKAHVATGAFLEALPAIERRVPVAVSEWGEGTRLGPYRLVRHVGSGGMAEVWLAARDDGSFERQVAIKLLFNHPTRVQRQTFAERFKRERDILASLHHPNIAALHDAGVTPGGQPWLALEYVQGRPITESCDARQLTIEQRVGVFRQAMLAVEYAHANLIIHRDLKPSNILVTDAGEVKLLDFGIAKLLAVGSEDAPDSELTRQGGRPLTPHYASPEQLSGRPLTTASDAYSLGVVLYQLLCGRRPFEGERVRSAAQIESAILAGDPMPPSKRIASDAVAASRGLGVKNLVRLLSGDMDAVTCKALGNDIARRYASIEAFRADLDRWCQGRPVLARRASAGYRVRKFYLRHKLGVWAGGLAMASVLGLTVATVLAGLRAQSESARAVASRDFVVDLFRVADPQNSRGQQLTPGDLLEAGRKRAIETFAGQPGLQADMLRQIGIMQGNVGEFRRADESLVQAATLFAREGRRRDWVGAQLDLANNAIHLGDLKRAAAAVEATTPQLGTGSDDLALQARYWSLKGTISRSSRDIARALDELMRALALATQASGETHVDAIDALRELADTYSVAGRFPEAMTRLEDAMRRARANPSIGSRDLFAIDSDLAITTVQAGRYAGSIERLRGLIERCDRELGPTDEHCAILVNYLGWLALRLDERPTRESLVVRLMATAANDSSPWRQAIGANLAAEILAVDGNLSARPALREQVLRISLTDTLPPRDRTQALLALGRAALRDGEVATARTWAETALTLQASLKGPDLDLVAKAYLIRGLARRREGHAEEALADIRAASATVSEALGATHPLAWLYRCNEAVVLVDLNRPGDAAPVLLAAINGMRPYVGEAPVLQRALRLLASLQLGSQNSSGVFHDEGGFV
jgi:serine/threonine protein kinase/tetratricopeptide (TPR) repeat protein